MNEKPNQIRSVNFIAAYPDGTTAEFRVTSIQTYLKDQFPTEKVYGPTPDAELRLITCGGAFDPATGHYLSNIVVYATEVR